MNALTVLNTASFDPRAQGALMLSLFEGLKNGEHFLMIAETGKEMLCEQLEALQLPNLKWQFVEKEPGRWKLKIEKLSDRDVVGHKAGGCCGMCGG